MSSSIRAVVSVRALRGVSLVSPFANMLPATAQSSAVSVSSFAPLFAFQVPLFCEQWASQITKAWQRGLGRETGDDSLTGALALDTPGAPTPAASEPSSSEIWDGLLLAAPKKKVSHSRKAMRSANKGLKDRISMYTCCVVLNGY